MITQSLLQSKFIYDQLTGIFWWKVGVNAGKMVGGSMNKGYFRIRVDQKLYYAHRLAWLYVYGKWPKEEIDHINSNRLDNRLINLREATRTENLRHKPTPKGISELKGVTKARQKWRAQCKVNGITHYLGVHATKEEAHEVYKVFALKHHGQFASIRS